MGYICHVNLDVFWSREPTTVKGSMTQLKKAARFCKDLGMTLVSLKMGPWPVEDKVGFRIAIVILWASQEEGRNDNTYQQFNSMRKLRTGYSNAYENSVIGNKSILAFFGEKGKALTFLDCPTESQVFTKFIKGLEVKMGKLVISNVGLDHRIFDNNLKDDTAPWKKKRKIIMTCAYLALCFGASLRGNEGFYLDGSS